MVVLGGFRSQQLGTTCILAMRQPVAGFLSVVTYCSAEVLVYYGLVVKVRGPVKVSILLGLP